MKSILFSALKQVATLTSEMGGRKLFILIFHRVLEQPDFMLPGEMDIANFSWRMELLAKYFNVLPLAEGLQRLQEGALPARSVCVTFDDGYADNYLNALPILQRFNLSATFFIATGYLNGGRMWNDSIIETIRGLSQAELDLQAIDLDVYPIAGPAQKASTAGKVILKLKYLPPAQRQACTDYIVSLAATALPEQLMMTSAQVQQLHASGMEIGGHTVTHPIIANISSEQLNQELADNKQTLEALINTPLRFFAYPNGKLGQDYLPEQVDIIKQHGYQAAVSTKWGVCHQGSDYWQLPRFTPWDTTPLKFMMRMAYMYQQPY